MKIHTFERYQYVMTILLAIILRLNAYAQSQERPRYVILITIDGLRAEMIDDPLMPSPFLKMMSRDGLRIGRVIGIPPAATYPSHTTLVTGEVPARHRVFYNRPFLWNKDTARISYWYADSIAVPTIWQRAHEAGMKTASLFWPVSTGSPYIDYNVPEFWSLDYSCDQMEYIKPYCTPSGILDELERNACGRLDTITYQAGSMQRDGRTAAMANYLMNHYQPRLMTIHLITTDYSQHALGTHSEQLLQDMASADHAVGSIIENLRLTHRLDSTMVIVTGDHGFCDYSQTLAAVHLVLDAYSETLEHVEGDEDVRDALRLHKMDFSVSVSERQRGKQAGNQL